MTRQKEVQIGECRHSVSKERDKEKVGFIKRG